ncbi:MAG: DNA-directed RNA polymerase subunit alpha [Thermoanaerobaculia bacterium]|jgi:DNA-directed RNA polymerase subunit alpha|nr:MAG: DNA-directed RNA polymerase subunit alpha [Thermoanaerobaculia bacterium]MBZ0101343.1 DNA-directed RNA polymerase subunit alpha [Thermoanaerobaculia bacterium]
MLWKGFQRPKRVEIDTETLTPTYGRFTAQPFERGFATTVGNALRRALLSSIEGAAITAIEIEGVQHEFSSIPGVKEDVTDIVLNLKQVPVRSYSAEAKILSLDVQGPREVKASDLLGDPQIEICDPEAPIATVNEEGRLRMQLLVQLGRGYVMADKNFDETLGVGWIAIDSLHSPVKRVNYKVETARVGRMTDYEKLTLEVWTNGTITPEHAVSLAATLLNEHLMTFVTTEEGLGGDAAGAPADAELESILARNLDDFDLSVRTANCLKNASISTVRDLVSRPEKEILEIKNFGKKSLEELQELLGRLGLSFGMNVSSGAGMGA